MVTRMEITFEAADQVLQKSVFRYTVLSRLARAAKRRDVTILAFGFGEHALRVLLHTHITGAKDVARAVQCGTLRSEVARTGSILWVDYDAQEGLDNEADLNWCYDGVINKAIENPWTSARDFAGLRQAPFFDANAARRRLATPHPDPPQPVSTPMRPQPHPLNTLLRIAGAVHGLPAHDPRCFPVFAQLAGEVGISIDKNAAALCVTPRRIYQLRRAKAPMLAAARRHLRDPQLVSLP